MNPVPVVIPFYKEHDKLKKCLAALAAQTQPCEPFVRDNTHDNILFTAAVNEGLARYCFRPDVPYVLVLNQDAYLRPDCVRQLVAFMDAHPDCGIGCPVQVAADSRTVSWSGSLRAFPTGVHRNEPLAGDAPARETYWANGAAMLVRSATVREIGLLDRNMRFICSDSDFSFTARARGWRVFVVPQALAEHALAASGGESPPELELVKLKDALYFARKWLTGGLYRELAAEGAGLTAGEVRRELALTRRRIQQIEQQLGAAAPSGPIAFPAWITGMHIPAPEQPAR